jgi:hypothetical protein
MEVDDNLVYNFFVDLKKKEIHPVDRANLIKEYCMNKKISLRQFAKDIGIPHSTIQDWVDYSRLTKLQFDKLLKKNGKKEVYKLLRNTRTKEINLKNDLDITLQECIIKLKPFINKPQQNINTPHLLQELHNIINRIELHIERGLK